MKNKIIEMKNDFSEMNKLAVGMINKKIPFMLHPFNKGVQILCDSWDATSYSSQDEFLEVAGKITQNTGKTEGWMTADEILAKLSEIR